MNRIYKVSGTLTWTIAAENAKEARAYFLEKNSSIILTRAKAKLIRKTAP